MALSHDHLTSEPVDKAQALDLVTTEELVAA